MKCLLVCILLWACQKETSSSLIQPSQDISPQEFPTSPSQACGDVLATIHGVAVHRNYGKGLHSCGDYHRKDGYDYGPKWQCVEFVRRYYKEHLNHSFPQKGNADQYFDASVPHGQRNHARGLIQYRNGHDEKPQENDLLVCQNIAPGYGHVAIITKVERDRVWIIQQNKEPAEEWFALRNENGTWLIEGGCTGFLRKSP